jgi:hypothetical protein
MQDHHHHLYPLHHHTFNKIISITNSKLLVHHHGAFFIPFSQLVKRQAHLLRQGDIGACPPHVWNLFQALARCPAAVR